MQHTIRSGHVRKNGSKRIYVKASKGRKAYSYIRKASKTRVKAVPAYDVGTAGQPLRRIGPLKKGMLTRYGYHPVEATKDRRKALSKAVHTGKEEPRAVVRRLVAISTLTKGHLPRASRIYKEDSKWVRHKFASRFKTDPKYKVVKK